jgi:DNA-binding IclR family transcriptional regulator
MVATKTPAIDKAAKIFHFIAGQGGATYSEIYQNVGLPQSTTSALLASLVTHGFLRQKDNKYLLGFVFYELGDKAIQDLDIRDVARDILRELSNKTGLAAHLGVLSGNAAIYLAKEEGKSAIAVKSWLGKRLSLHSSSLGKVLLAWQPESIVDKLLPQEDLERFTSKTITSKTQYKSELVRVRERGWAFDDEEDYEGVSCLAAPVFDKDRKTVIAAISISGVSFQVPKDKIAFYASCVVEAAETLAKKYQQAIRPAGE